MEAVANQDYDKADTLITGIMNKGQNELFRPEESVQYLSLFKTLQGRL